MNIASGHSFSFPPNIMRACLLPFILFRLFLGFSSSPDKSLLKQIGCDLLVC